jgi:hypothetical protein
MARCTHYDDIIEIIVESGVGCGKCMMVAAELKHSTSGYEVSKIRSNSTAPSMVIYSSH